MLTGPAYADSGVDVYNPPRGFDSGSDKPHETKIPINALVTWYIREGTHNITPAEDVPGGQKWGQKGSGDLAVGDPDFVASHFTKAGQYYYFSSTNGEGKDDKGHLSGMYGVINVIDPNAPTTTSSTTTTTTTPDTQPTTDTTAHPATPTTTPTTAPAVAGPAAAHTPPPAAPAPTTTTAAKADKNKSPKDSSTTTTTVPPPGLIDLPDSAIIPLLPSSATVQDGAIAEPGSVPEGDAVALIKKKHSHKGMLVLVATGLGIGALGIGAAGYKFAHRSSKYFPA
jgi:plastocyanin